MPGPHRNQGPRALLAPQAPGGGGGGSGGPRGRSHSSDYRCQTERISYQKALKSSQRTLKIHQETLRGGLILLTEEEQGPEDCPGEAAAEGGGWWTPFLPPLGATSAPSSPPLHPSCTAPSRSDVELCLRFGLLF